MAVQTVYITRHAQAEHNVAEDYSIPDAPLTALGRRQAKELNDKTKELQSTADCLIVSPLQRTLSTALDGYPDLIARLGKANVTCHPFLQEGTHCHCLNTTQSLTESTIAQSTIYHAILAAQ